MHKHKFTVVSYNAYSHTNLYYRSANYYAGTCELSDMDRTTLSGTTNTANSFEQMEGEWKKIIHFLLLCTLMCI
jgi:hypothetical protein